MSEKTNEDSVAVWYMKLVAEVHKDIAELKKGDKDKWIDSCDFNATAGDKKHGTYLFNNSPPIRKLFVFLVTENLEDINMTGCVKNNLLNKTR